jgi:hypothetical protein
MSSLHIPAANARGTSSDFNPRNDLKLPLRGTKALDKINLDLDSPRLKKAMDKLQVRREDMQLRAPAHSDVGDILKMRNDAAKR